MVDLSNSQTTSSISPQRLRPYLFQGHKKHVTLLEGSSSSFIHCQHFLVPSPQINFQSLSLLAKTNLESLKNDKNLTTISPCPQNLQPHVFEFERPTPP
jgi:hypothetical protein